MMWLVTVRNYNIKMIFKIQVKCNRNEGRGGGGIIGLGMGVRQRPL